jgi:hypothetical protein
MEEQRGRGIECRGERRYYCEKIKTLLELMVGRSRSGEGGRCDV